MADQPTHAAIRDALLGAANLDSATGGPMLVEEADRLAEAVMEALATTGLGLSGTLLTGTGEGQALPPITQGERTGPALVGPFLTSEELGWMRSASNAQERRAPGGYLAMALRHIDAQAATIRNQNREMDDQQRRVRELGRLQSEVVRLVRWVGPDVDVLAIGASADFPLIFELVRAAQAEREGRRG